MKILKKEEFLQMPTAVAIGNFDGVHIGHKILIETLKINAKYNNLCSLIFTFENHTTSIFDNKIKYLTTIEKKIQLFKDIDVNFVYFQKFDKQFASLSKEDFIKKILLDRFNTKMIVAGFDFCFGKNKEGNPKILVELGNKYNLQVIIIPPIEFNNKIISSSLIRKLIEEGDVETARQFLGRNYSIKGKVISGQKIGSVLGFPTANIDYANNICIPKKGVYITKTLINDRSYKSITNIGLRPTVSGNTLTIETHIPSFNQDIYNLSIEIEFLKYIREEKKFDSLESLKYQIQKDIESLNQFTF